MSQLIYRLVEEYENSLQTYQQVASAIEQRCRELLGMNHIPAVTTSRAKCRIRLEEKLEMSTFSTIQKPTFGQNMPDLSGVRIALYFPSQEKEAIQLLQQFFVPILVKVYDSTPTAEQHPGDSPLETLEDRHCIIPSVPTQHIFRPTGYHATHLHMRTSLGDSLAKQSPTTEDPTLEIQITTLLMHAWSGVDHELAYKGHREELSNEEVHVLGEANRHIVASEALIQQLEEFVKNRNNSRRTN